MKTKTTYQDLLVKDGSWPNTAGQYRKPRKSFDVWFPPTWNVEIKKPIKVHGVRIEKNRSRKWDRVLCILNVKPVHIGNALLSTPRRDHTAKSISQR